MKSSTTIDWGWLLFNDLLLLVIFIYLLTKRIKQGKTLYRVGSRNNFFSWYMLAILCLKTYTYLLSIEYKALPENLSGGFKIVILFALLMTIGFVPDVIQEGGLVSFGIMLNWKRIKSFRWHPSDLWKNHDQECLIFTQKKRGFFRERELVWRVSLVDKQRIEAILQQYLAKQEG